MLLPSRSAADAFIGDLKTLHDRTAWIVGDVIAGVHFCVCVCVHVCVFVLVCVLISTLAFCFVLFCFYSVYYTHCIY